MTSQVLVRKLPGSVGTCILLILSGGLWLTKCLLLARVVLFVIGVRKRVLGEGGNGGRRGERVGSPKQPGAPDLLSCLYIALRFTEIASVGRMREVL